MKMHLFHGKRNLCGSKIQALRKQKGISQEDFAARMQILGVTIERDSISRIEIGTRFISDFELMTIAKILEVPIEALFETDSQQG